MPNEKDTIGLSHTQMAASVRLGFSLKRFQGNRRSWPDTWVKETSNGDISIAPKMWQRLGFWEDFYDGDRQAEDIFRDERDKILGITVTGAKTPNSAAQGATNRVTHGLTGATSGASMAIVQPRIEIMEKCLN
jgi:hypothetical protein